QFLAGTYNGSATLKASNVLVREPLSGTYNTMEYNVPNSNHSGFLSQDVGSQGAAQNNCDPTNSTKPRNPSTINGVVNYTFSLQPVGGRVRARPIGTGQKLPPLSAGATAPDPNNPNNPIAVGGSTDTLGYGFWSVGNFAGPTAGSKYLLVQKASDNTPIDPL